MVVYDAGEVGIGHVIVILLVARHEGYHWLSATRRTATNMFATL